MLLQEHQTKQDLKMPPEEAAFSPVGQRVPSFNVQPSSVPPFRRNSRKDSVAFYLQPRVRDSEEKGLQPIAVT